jgi:UDP-glucose 4-epimerase
MMYDDQLRKFYAGRTVLVTGGLGFIGSNLALALHSLGARVTILDSLTEGCGGDLRNLGEAASDFRVLIADIACPDTAAVVLPGVDVIFNLASEIAHTPTIGPAFRDLALNVSSQLSFLGHCVTHAPGSRIVYTSTRQVYGAPQYLPVDEKHPLHPVDFNGVHKLAASQYHLLLWRMGQLDSVVLYLTNVYGPRIALHLPQQGFLARFLSRALRGEALDVFGDGQQLRDPLYISDAVEAILCAGCAAPGDHRCFNIGHPETHSVIKIAEMLSGLAGLPSLRLKEFPSQLKSIDVGSYATDVRLGREVLGWQARVSLKEGLSQSLHFYRANAAGSIVFPDKVIPDQGDCAAQQDQLA